MSEKRVVNTSPLIYLSRAGMLNLLRTESESVIVPQGVADETGAWPTADAAQSALKTFDWLQIVPAQIVPPLVAAWDLGVGESGVLAYGLNHPGMVLVVDDLAARRCAASLGMTVRGTLGLVLAARKRGEIGSARSALMQLRDAGMYLSDGVLNLALREVGE